MKARYKKHIPDWMHKAACEAAKKEYEAIKKKHEDRVWNMYEFMFMLGLAITLKEKLGFGDARKKDFMTTMVKNINEISAYLISNKVVKAGEKGENYDIEYNREYLKRLAEQNGVTYNEEVFDDVY